MTSRGTSSTGNSEGGSDSGHQMITALTRKRISVGVVKPMVPPGISKEDEVTSTNQTSTSDDDMLNDYVMEHLLGYLPLTDLKNCRLVNHFWNQASLRAIIKMNHFLVFNQENCKVSDVPGIIQLIQRSIQFPWTKFDIDAAIVKTAEDKQQFVNLFRVIAPFAREIRVMNLTMELFPENVEFPVLHSLKLQYNQDAIPSEGIQICALGIVGQAPKLDELVLTGLQMMPLFMAILELPNCRKITRLSISSRMEAGQLGNLSEMGFQLKYLKLTIFHPRVDIPAASRSVLTLLQSQSKCLEEMRLDIRLECVGFVTISEWPRMEKLAVLRVPNPQLYSEISYRDHFPALKRLNFSLAPLPFFMEMEPGETFFNDQMEPLETMETLEFGWKINCPRRIIQAARQFPKLRKLRFKPDRSSLNILGQVMPCLEEVVLLVGAEDNLDEILTGFSLEEIGTIIRLPLSQVEALERSREPLPFLKNLKKLRLETNYTERQMRITGFACRFALLRMEHLKVLEIAGNCRHIRNQVMEAMKNKFVVVVET